MKHCIDIYYCTQCGWLLRSAWMAQELLTTFSDDIETLSLHPDTGGYFEVRVDQQRIWNRKADGGFPAITELKQRVRDAIDPERSLGHSDQ
ncbi:SelT/selW/selH domain [gamma proteobacterium HTCC5015]|nr:SelT/selW/selH domain [gamma proteobacterium HTCC5015]